MTGLESIDCVSSKHKLGKTNRRSRSAGFSGIYKRFTYLQLINQSCTDSRLQELTDQAIYVKPKEQWKQFVLVLVCQLQATGRWQLTGFAKLTDTGGFVDRSKLTETLVGTRPSCISYSPPVIFRRVVRICWNVGRWSGFSCQQLRIRSNIGFPSSVVSGRFGRNGMLSPFLTRLTTSSSVKRKLETVHRI